jgi:phosphopantothenoylcysteine decarboxylase/phosphopantothenate--cysteine ligase
MHCQVRLYRHSRYGCRRRGLYTYGRGRGKNQKRADAWSLELTKTRDILGALGDRKKPGQILVGFALETQDEKTHALGKMESKHADLIVLNSLRDAGAGFGYDTNKISIFGKDGQEWSFGLKSKEAVASDIVDTIYKLIVP